MTLPRGLMDKLGIYWFSHDLRVDDNPTLTAAAQEVDQLLCIAFTHTKLDYNFHSNPVQLSQNRLNFLLQSFVDLNQTLQKYGQHLLVCTESAEHKIASLITDYEITHLYLGDDGQLTKEAIVRSLQEKFPALIVRKLGDNCLYSQRSLPFSVSDLPTTFSKFRRKVESISTQTITPAPKCLPVPICSPELWQKEYTYLQSSRQCQFYGGECEGNRHLEKYFQGDYAHSYKLTRNTLCGDYESTKFSPWLANGCLSVRRILQALYKYEAEMGNNESTYWIFFELLWREYFQWYAKCHRERLFSFSGIKGNNPSTSFYPERFRKWCEGNTPFAIVNACMKQLNATGYMSNRGRQLVASCFVNELALDWRYGAAYMAQQLIDYDMASNWGNWQYLAGVGADPRGLRHFDLEKQTQRYDPDQVFIRHWQGYADRYPLDSVDAADWPVDQSPAMTVNH